VAYARLNRLALRASSDHQLASTQDYVAPGVARFCSRILDRYAGLRSLLAGAARRARTATARESPRTDREESSRECTA